MCKEILRKSSNKHQPYILLAAEPHPPDLKGRKDNPWHSIDTGIRILQVKLQRLREFCNANPINPSIRPIF